MGHEFLKNKPRLFTFGHFFLSLKPVLFGKKKKKIGENTFQKCVPCKLIHYIYFLKDYML